MRHFTGQSGPGGTYKTVTLINKTRVLAKPKATWWIASRVALRIKSLCHPSIVKLSVAERMQ